jgi:hypothetical protein
MEYIIAVGVIAALGVVAYMLRGNAKPTATRPAEFTCRNCGEKHCQCERQA